MSPLKITAASLLLITQLLSGPAQAQDPIEEILVTGERDTRTYLLAETLDVAPDSAALLKHAVGANLVSNGPLTGIAQVRGMSRMHISSRINGQVISPGGPNWMDAPLSYAPAAHLGEVEVHRGIASVSAGMETLGGVVNARTWQGEFADSGTLLQGRLRGGAASVNHATLMSAALVAANERQRLKLSALTEQADDAEFADGEILPTEYRRDRYDIGYGLRTGRHQFSFDYGRSETEDAGNPALPMDIDWIDSNLYGMTYGFDGERFRVDGNLYYSDISHGMTNYHLRTAPMNGAMYRRNVTGVDNLGFSLVATVDEWRFGIDGHDESHDSDISNPNNPMFHVVNFRNADRTLLGAFLEREFEFGEHWRSEIGVRVNRVEMDADEVGSSMAMPPAMALRDAFNTADRSQNDTNVDWVGKLYYQAGEQIGYYAGLSRKTRSPAYQERYLWLPLEATAGLADGRTYTGTIDLQPEVAHEVELGIDFTGDRLSLSPRLFYRDVDDYIQGTTSTNTAAVMLVRMMNLMNGTSNPDPLEFTNVDAELYGFDMDWRFILSESWSLNGVVNYVRGRRTDSSDDLYRLAPLNGFVALNYGAERWGWSLEGQFADGQTRVSETVAESESSGYAVFNTSGFLKLGADVRLSAGVDNIADRDYADHLAGINRVMGNPDIAQGERLPAYGRNFFLRLDYDFR